MEKSDGCFEDYMKTSADISDILLCKNHILFLLGIIKSCGRGGDRTPTTLSLMEEIRSICNK